MRPTYYPILFATLIAAPSLRTLDAQTRTPQPPPPPRDGEVRIERLPQGMSIYIGGSNRAALGITLSTDSRADSNGVPIADVRVDGPAAKAGLKAGDVITAVNGVSLRISGADAADPELAGIGQRRLQRALAKARAGDEVDVRVQSAGSTKSVKVKTIAQSELDGERPRIAGTSGGLGDRDRPAIGIMVGASNSLRDTLGLFISSVVAKGPAELAGVVEGERIAAINGVDVRVPREDVEDFRSAESRVKRFVSEVQKGEAGQALTLRVYGGGRYRDVSVETVRTSTLDNRLGFDMTGGRIRIDGETIEIGRESIERNMDQLRRHLQDMGHDLQLRIREQMTDRPLMTAPRTRVLQRRTITIL